MRSPDRGFLIITHYQRLSRLHRTRRGACHVRWENRA